MTKNTKVTGSVQSVGYTIIAKGTNAGKVQEEAIEKYEKLNAQLQKKDVEPLGEPTSQEFVLECIVDASFASEHAKALSAEYKSNTDFTDALKKASKGYGKIQFTVKTWSLTQTYKLAQSQKDVLSPKKSTPAGRLDYGNRDNITKYL